MINSFSLFALRKIFETMYESMFAKKFHLKLLTKITNVTVSCSGRGTWYKSNKIGNSLESQSKGTVTGTS